MALRSSVAPLALSLVLSSLSGAALAGRDVGQIAMLDKADKAAAQSSADLARSVEAHRHELPLDHGPHATATAWSNRRLLALRPESPRSSYATAVAPRE